jgi:hypothetical protein
MSTMLGEDGRKFPLGNFELAEAAELVQELRKWQKGQ